MEGSLTAVNPCRLSIKAVSDLETRGREEPTEDTRKSQGSGGGEPMSFMQWRPDGECSKEWGAPRIVWVPLGSELGSSGGNCF